jgi:Mn-dependent DtxR family transcriptional regulator
MTVNAQKVLETLKQNYGKKWITADLAEAAGVSAAAVTGAVTGLCKKGYAVREEGVVPVTIVKDGVETTSEKTVKFISLTEEGLQFSPSESEEN